MIKREIKEQEKMTHFNEGEWKNYRLARMGDRLMAYVLDIIVVNGISVILGAISGGMVWQIPFFAMRLMTIGVVGAVYFSLFTKLWGQTLGKMVVGIRVIQKNGDLLDWKTVLLREVAGRTVSQLFGVHLGYLWAAISKKNQGWHDLLVDTYVVVEPEMEKRWIIQVPSSAEDSLQSDN
ncbi:RDD family protein [Tindallia californiensis]|uniref:Uncharacterized membrane protein YckC, RDD family n=1 Tax=Tindallia californiensis TaxID=159292 RepID=A0A1H3M840_9FIRM|nr:RDD family protein [Tindallia californiensis]SDY72438.1 Uncharacterized membrane protein YckC, RDD family [Tindallia californiensis]